MACEWHGPLEPGRLRPVDVGHRITQPAVSAVVVGQAFGMCGSRCRRPDAIGPKQRPKRYAPDARLRSCSPIAVASIRFESGRVTLGSHGISASTFCDWQPRSPPTMAAAVSVSPPSATARFIAIARLVASRRTWSTLASVVTASAAISAVDAPSLRSPPAGCGREPVLSDELVGCVLRSREQRVPEVSASLHPR
jgi:hypothetical protein